MNNKLKVLILLALLVNGIIIISGCVQENNLSQSTEDPITQPTTQPTAVTPAQDNEEYCISNETGTMMSISEAIKIGKNSECSTQGTLKDTYFCNEYTGTWWIDLEPLNEQPGCNPACVVNVNTKTAEINWRCTGVIQPNN